uniref:Putative secreted protein n=1 Tax=Xenopsylla cheopis TaxID=163159 RepID=A0A6M2E130_XENCH
MKLWISATEIIRLCWIPAISDLNQRSTTMHTNCGQCGRSLARSGWYCTHCKSMQGSKCIICHQTVRGLYVWCQSCSHGGHVNHMKEWFANQRQCPTGCGHNCEY